jgi:hypothetical protein
MVKINILKTAVVAVALTSIGLAGTAGFDGEAFAKSGNGNSGGGSSGNGGGGGHGNSPGKEDNASSGNNGKSDSGWSDKVASRGATQREDKTRHTAQRSTASELRGLNSLKRNFQAYLNSKDARLAGVAAYVQNYAEYEIQTGRFPTADDPQLGDAALKSALADFSKTNITARQLSWAKDALGVGSSVGKIDQVRAAMASGQDAVE